MPNARIKNSVAHTGIRNSLPNVRVSSFQTTRSGEEVIIARGTPIGLLLTLTYANDFKVALPFYGDYRPNVRIR